MKTQFTKAHEVLQSALSEQVRCSGEAWGTLLNLLNNREQALECLTCQVYIQFQELAVIQLQAKEDGKWMSIQYINSCAETNKI